MENMLILIFILKYNGIINSLYGLIFNINDFDVNDEVLYRLKVEMINIIKYFNFWGIRLFKLGEFVWNFLIYEIYILLYL